MKKSIALLLVLLLALAACTAPAPTADPTPSVAPPTGTESEGPSEPVSLPSEPAESVWVRLGVLKGALGLSALRILKEGGASNNYDARIFTANDEVVAGLTNGSLDIAALATNVAANLYNKTDGAVQIIAVNSLGVLYILENGNTVSGIPDLAGRTIYAMGQGANPEYVLQYLVERYGGNYADINVEWRSQEDITALMLSGEADLCMLPVPAATTVLVKNPDVRTAIHLTDEWALVSDSPLAQSCFVARTAFIEEQPHAVASFIADLADSVAVVNADPEKAGAWAEEYAIVPAAAIATAAIPQANLVCLTGRDMQAAAQGYFEVLYAANPASIGGFSPDDAFYYLGE